MPKITDMLGRQITLPQNNEPLRIISLVPSQTELLYDLGLEKEVVGITNYCIHPKKWRKEKMKIGGTKKLNLDTIHALKPNLIIANKEENNQSDIRVLEEKYPIWISDITTLDDALKMIKKIGIIVGRVKKAEKMSSSIKKNISQIQQVKNKTCAYLIWKDPLMVASSMTFIHEILQKMGFSNVFKNESRYPEVSFENLKEKTPDYLFLSSEPYPFKQEHLDEFQQFLPTTKVLLVDGEIFSWYGSRMLKINDYWNDLYSKIL